jgi:hypothetical protein
MYWEAGEVVADVMVLPLSEVPSGGYRLAVGVYDAITGERLPDDAGDLTVLSDALILQAVTIP